MPRNILTLFIALATLALSSQAQTLLVNRQVHASTAQGRDVEVLLTGTPLAAMILAFNVDPGPTVINRQVIPLGIGSTLMITHNMVPIPASGTFEASMPIAFNAALEGVTLYGAAIVIDPTNIGVGFTVSNGVSMTFTRKTEAGEDNAGFVGQPVVLDGSATLADGPIPAGFEFSWEIIFGPVGHQATLEGADTLFPTLRADLPGTYKLELCLQAPGTTGGSFDVAEVHIYDLDLGGLAEVPFDASAQVAASGAFSGANGSAYSLLGLDNDADQDGTVAGSQSAGDELTPFFFQAVSPRGVKTQKFLPMVNGESRSLNDTIADALAVHLRDEAFDPLEDLIGTAAAGLDIAALLQPFFDGLEPIPVVDIPAPFPPGATLFSASILPTEVAIDPGVTVNIETLSDALAVSLTFSNFVLTFDIFGETLLTGPYTDIGTLTVPELTLTVALSTVISNGVFESSVESSSLDLVGATLTFETGVIPAAFSTQVLNAVIPALEGVIGGVLAAAVPLLVDTVLNAIPQSFDAAGVTFSAVASRIGYTLGGLTLGFGVGINTSALANPLPDVHYLATDNGLPTFGPVVPTSGDPYQTALAIADDLVNLALANAQNAEQISFEFTGPLEVFPGLRPIPLNAGSMATFLPGLGFDRFPADAEVRFVFTIAAAPFLSLGDDSKLVLPDLVVEAFVQLKENYEVPAVQFGLYGSLVVTPEFNFVTNEITLTTGEGDFEAYARGSLPAVDLETVLPGIAALIDLLLPSLSDALPPLPLPQLPALGGSELIGFEFGGDLNDYMATYFGPVASEE
ncbi:MAG: hypothetical protein V3W41_17625 [Planctomycetota bacterium]